MQKNALKFSGVALTTLLLSACGGGGGDTAITGANGTDTNSVPPETNTDTNTNTTDDSANAIPAAITPTVDSTDNGNPLFYSIGNNSARLTGPVFGTAELTGTDVVEKLEIYGPVGNAGGNVVGAYATRHTFGDPDTNLILVIHNSTDTPFCPGIYSMSVVNKDGNFVKEERRTVPETYRPNATGSNFDNVDLDGDYFVWDCAGPGELIYGTVNLNPGDDPDLATDYGLAAGITGSEPLGFGLENTPSDPVLPLSYTVNGDGDVEVLVENQSNRTYEVDGSAFPLSTEGYPMFEMYSPTDPLMAPGESAILVFPVEDFKGSASSLRVVIELRIPR